MENEVSNEQQRAELAAEVFETAPPETLETPQIVEPEPTPVDEWAGVPPQIKEKFTGLESKLKDFDAVQFRLQQAERRIGSVTNELAQAKKAAEERMKQPAPPTNEEIADAAKSDAAWNEFREMEPAIAIAVEAKMRRDLQAATGKTPDIAAIRAEIVKDVEEKANSVRDFSNSEIKALREELVSIRHPNWEEDVKTEDFKKFRQSRPDLEAKIVSTRPSDAVQVLDAFKEFKSKPQQKTAAQIKAERESRLQSSVVAQPRTTPTKAEPDNVRASLAKAIWAD